MSKFRYRERSAETVSARSKQTGGQYDSYLNTSLSFLKVKEGQNDLRIMPPTWDVDGPFGDNWGIEIYVHRDIGPDKGTYLCLDKMREKYGSKAVPSKLGVCPLCAARHEVEDDDAEAQKALKPGKQILAYVINRDDQKAGPQVWRLGWQLERDIQIRSQDKKTGAVIPLDHPDTGYDISFTREGTGLKTKYVGVDIARDDSPLHDKQVTQDKWLAFIEDNPLPEQLLYHDADYLEQVYMGKKGSKGGNAEDTEEDDRPTRSKRPARDAEEEDERPRARRAAAEEEEEETPRRRRAAEPEEEEDAPPPRRRPARGQEEEEEEDQPRRRRSAEPEEEEETPRRRRPAAEEEEDDRLPTDAEMARNSAKLKKRPAEEEEEEPAPPRRRRQADPEEEEDAPPPRAKAKRPPADEEEEGDGEEEDVPPPKASSRAKASLDRLKSRK